MVNPTSVQVTLAKGTFSGMAEAKNVTVATKPYFNFGPSGAAQVNVIRR